MAPWNIYLGGETAWYTWKFWESMIEKLIFGNRKLKYTEEKMIEIAIKYFEKIWSMIFIIGNWKLNWQNNIKILRIDDTFEIPSWKLKTENYRKKMIIALSNWIVWLINFLKVAIDFIKSSMEN